MPKKKGKPLPTQPLRHKKKFEELIKSGKAKKRLPRPATFTGYQFKLTTPLGLFRLDTLENID